ncbi:hypothetical protein SEVIR_9G485250v4 [Setaria viridis]
MRAIHEDQLAGSAPSTKAGLLTLFFLFCCVFSPAAVRLRSSLDCAGTLSPGPPVSHPCTHLITSPSGCQEPAAVVASSSWVPWLPAPICGGPQLFRPSCLHTV